MVAVENLEGDSGSFSSEINKQGDQYLKHSENEQHKTKRRKKQER